MTALELFAILVLAGAVVILLYYYLQAINKTGSAGFDTFKSSFTDARKGVSEAGGRFSEGISNPSFDSVKSSVSDVGNKFSGVGSSVSESVSKQYSEFNSEGEGRMSGVTERVSGMSDKLKGKVKEVPISTDVLSGRIDEFLNDQSDRLIKDWRLATKSDVNDLEKRYLKVSRDVDNLSKRFDEFRGHANKKFEHIENRLAALEGEEEI